MIYKQQNKIFRCIRIDMLERINLYSTPRINTVSFKAQTQAVSDTFSKSPLQPSLLTYLNAQLSVEPLRVEFYNSISLSQMLQKYGVVTREIAKDLNNRAGQKGQVLNWINILPKTQLKRLDEIYTLADSLKQNGSNKLAIIGIGGSKHTIENLLHLNGFADKAVFLSACDPDSVKDFVTKNLDNSSPAVLVASKSGTTLEPSYDFEMVQKALGDNFKNYVCITDADATKSKLRQIANDKGYKCGVIHDECGGRFGAFDDHALVALAYCGMPKDDMAKMLNTALSAQQKYLNPDISKNIALQRAVYNAEAILNGKQNQYDYYFGDRFEGTALWNTQLKKESHKSLYKQSGDLIGPAFLHNSTEADLDEANNSSFYTFNKIKNNGSSDYKIANALFNGSLKAYSDRHPVSVITLKDLSPESIAEYVELKHFETIYTGMLLRAMKNDKTSENQPLKEVVQPHVGIYKAEVNKILDLGK